MKRFPVAVDKTKVGKYPVLTKSGGGHFYDEVLEYRVWYRKGAELRCAVFASYSNARAFALGASGAEKPLVLVRQKEWINEPKDGVFEHRKDERITEWQVEWLRGSKRKEDTIERFMNYVWRKRIANKYA